MQLLCRLEGIGGMVIDCSLFNDINSVFIKSFFCSAKDVTIILAVFILFNMSFDTSSKELTFNNSRPAILLCFDKFIKKML